jgi:hypothetical protein
MIAAAALLLMGLSATEADATVLRQVAEPRWTVAAQTRPIELIYQREPGQMIAGSARADFALDPATTLFMQARKQKQETQWDSPKGLAKSTNRAVSVGLALHW